VSRSSQDGCQNLGIAYENGKGVAADVAHAAQLYEQACAAKAATACFFLADLRSVGKGVERDDKRATALYARV
jgi:hypothetical protein